MTDSVLCPEIEHEQEVISSDTMDALFLSNEDRSVGSKVTVTCLSNATHKLVGSSVLRCNETGQWDNVIPQCVSKFPQRTDIIFDADASGRSGGEDYGMLPFIVALALLGVTCLLLVFLLAYMLRLLSKGDKSHLLLTESRSTTPVTRQEATESWVELASSIDNFDRRHFIHSRENGKPVEGLRYAHLPQEWSGY